MITRKDKTYKITNLPKLRSNSLTFNGRTGFTGSLIKRSVKGTIGLFKHTGLVYGYDKKNTLWIIENNLNGVECITLRDFTQGMNYIIEPNTNPLIIETIMSRVHERATEIYNARKNNCEHFTNYCLAGIHHSNQTETTENIVNALLSIAEMSLVGNSSNAVSLEAFNKFRNSIQLDRPESIESVIKDILNNRTAVQTKKQTSNQMVKKVNPPSRSGLQIQKSRRKSN